MSHWPQVVMDDIGHNDLGFANPTISTPFVDSLAIEHGLQLTHFYTAKECAPTRGVSTLCSLLCGSACFVAP
eukprot:COSAG02_NODE_3905_length_6058_cov_5.265481_1_plen_72_part_00